MRAILFLGFLIIGSAIRANHTAPQMSDQSAKFFAIVLLVAIIMDVAEFIKKMNK